MLCSSVYWADVHIKQRAAEVLAGQADADLGVCKVCEARRKEASRQRPILCTEHGCLCQSSSKLTVQCIYFDLSTIPEICSVLVMQQNLIHICETAVATAV